MYGTMTERRPTPAQLKRRLERLSAEYQAAKAKFAEVGFTGEGSLIERYTTRNNPNCRCPIPSSATAPTGSCPANTPARPYPGSCRPRTPRATKSGSPTAAASTQRSRE
jgi:hypothetical protein